MVYVLEEIDFNGRSTGYYKIGKGAPRPNATMNPRELIVLYNIKLTEKFDYKMERILHGMFNIFRVKRRNGSLTEWFHGFNRKHPEFHGIFKTITPDVFETDYINAEDLMNQETR